MKELTRAVCQVPCIIPASTVTSARAALPAGTNTVAVRRFGEFVRKQPNAATRLEMFAVPKKDIRIRDA